MCLHVVLLSNNIERLPYIFEVKYFCYFHGFACYLKILTMQKTVVLLLSMITGWPSSKIYSRKGSILENFVPQKFPNHTVLQLSVSTHLMIGPLIIRGLWTNFLQGYSHHPCRPNEIKIKQSAIH